MSTRVLISLLTTVSIFGLTNSAHSQNATHTETACDGPFPIAVELTDDVSACGFGYNSRSGFSYKDLPIQIWGDNQADMISTIDRWTESAAELDEERKPEIHIFESAPGFEFFTIVDVAFPFYHGPYLLDKETMRVKKTACNKYWSGHALEPSPANDLQIAVGFQEGYAIFCGFNLKTSQAFETEWFELPSGAKNDWFRWQGNKLLWNFGTERYQIKLDENRFSITSLNEASVSSLNRRTPKRVKRGSWLPYDSSTPVLDTMLLGILGLAAQPGPSGSSRSRAYYYEPRESNSNTLYNDDRSPSTAASISSAVNNTGGYKFTEHIRYKQGQSVVARGRCSDGTNFNVRYSPSTGAAYRYTIYSMSAGSKNDVAAKFCAQH